MTNLVVQALELGVVDAGDLRELPFEFADPGLTLLQPDECVDVDDAGGPENVVGILRGETRRGEHCSGRGVGVIAEPWRSDDADDRCVDGRPPRLALVEGVELFGVVQVQRHGVADAFVERVHELLRHRHFVGPGRVGKPAVEHDGSLERVPHLVVDEREAPDRRRVDVGVPADALDGESRDRECRQGLDLRHRSHHIPVEGPTIEQHHHGERLGLREQAIHRGGAPPRSGSRGGDGRRGECDQEEQPDERPPAAPPLDPEPHPDGAHRVLPVTRFAGRWPVAAERSDGRRSTPPRPSRRRR